MLGELCFIKVRHTAGARAHRSSLPESSLISTVATVNILKRIILEAKSHIFRFDFNQVFPFKTACQKR